MNIETASCKSGLRLVLNAEERKVANYAIVQSQDISFPFDENTTEEQMTLIHKSSKALRTEYMANDMREMILSALPDADLECDRFKGLASEYYEDEGYNLRISYEEAGYEHWDLVLTVDGQRYKVDLDELGCSPWGAADLVAI